MDTSHFNDHHKKLRDCRLMVYYDKGCVNLTSASPLKNSKISKKMFNISAMKTTRR